MHPGVALRRHTDISPWYTMYGDLRTLFQPCIWFILHYSMLAPSNVAMKALAFNQRFYLNAPYFQCYIVLLFWFLSGRQRRFFSSFLFPSIFGGQSSSSISQGTTNKLNTECFGGTTCTFFLNCYLSGGTTKDTCGFFYSCCMKSRFEHEVLPTREYGPVRNDPGSSVISFSFLFCASI